MPFVPYFKKWSNETMKMKNVIVYNRPITKLIYIDYINIMLIIYINISV